jgi:HSP20 family protein
MALIRWFGDEDVFSRLDRMQRDMDRLWSSMSPGAGSRSGAAASTGVYPPLNVLDDGESFRVRAEVPGVDPGSIDIAVTANTVTIRGERTMPEVPENASWHRRERAAGKFRRSLTLPEQVDDSKVTARCENGILEVLLPRAESARPRKIDVEVG